MFLEVLLIVFLVSFIRVSLIFFRMCFRILVCRIRDIVLILLLIISFLKIDGIFIMWNVFGFFVSLGEVSVLINIFIFSNILV